MQFPMLPAASGVRDCWGAPDVVADFGGDSPGQRWVSVGRYADHQLGEKGAAPGYREVE